MVLPFIACYCVCYIRNCVVFENIVFFVLYLLGYSLVLYGFVCMELVLQSIVGSGEEVFHKVFHKVLQGIVGSGVRKGGGTQILGEA